MRFLVIATILFMGSISSCFSQGSSSGGGPTGLPSLGGSPSPGAFTANAGSSPSPAPGSGCVLSSIVPVGGGPCGASSPPFSSASPVPNGGSSPSSGASTMMEVTFYNLGSTKGSTTTADPGVSVSEGSGAYTDPITLATAPGEISDKAIVYVKGFNKYFIHTDDCVSCTADWASGKYHVDLWLGTDSANCAVTWGVLQLPVVLNPSTTLPVSSQPMDNGTCFPLPSPLPTS